MTLNQNSLSAKLYKWFYETDKLPANLCPYFWLLVVAYTFGLLKLTGIGIRSLFGKFLRVLFIIELIICGLFFLYCNIQLILCLCNCYSYNSKCATIAAWMDLGAIAVSLLLFIIFGVREMIVGNDKKLIAVEFVKSKYGKYCPHIEWKNSETA